MVICWHMLPLCLEQKHTPVVPTCDFTQYCQFGKCFRAITITVCHSMYMFGWNKFNNRCPHDFKMYAEYVVIKVVEHITVSYWY